MGIFGHITSVPIGKPFDTRADSIAVARNAQSGMVGGAEGTESIVLNGGYVDDIDLGSLIVYTGQGGQSETRPKVQVRDQVLERGNLGLKVSHERGLPVRVIRGFKGDRVFSPATGYRYDGLYRVSDFGTGTSNGFLIYRATLEAIPGEVNQNLPAPYAGRTRTNAPAVTTMPPNGNAAPQSRTRPATAIERKRAVAAWVKNLYSDKRQVCGIALTVPAGTASAGAHIRPLGGSHTGPDTSDNVLCLCHNCHFLFDHKGIVIGDDLRVHRFNAPESVGYLTVNEHHWIDMSHVRYHRQLSNWATSI